MLRKQYIASSLATIILFALPVFQSSQVSNEKPTLIINGESTRVPVVEVNGHPFIGLESFADTVKGSLSYSGSIIALSMPIAPPNTRSSPTTSSQTSTEGQAPNLGFSRGFLNAGIEQMSTLREWHTALATAIQSGIPLSVALLAPYRAQATTNLHLASVAATTPSDRSAYQLLSNEFQNMTKLTDKYINKRAKMSYIPPDALEADNLNQRIIACGRSLGAMAASGQFLDDGSCN